MTSYVVLWVVCVFIAYSMDDREMFGDDMTRQHISKVIIAMIVAVPMAGVAYYVLCLIMGVKLS